VPLLFHGVPQVQQIRFVKGCPSDKSGGLTRSTVHWLYVRTSSPKQPALLLLHILDLRVWPASAQGHDASTLLARRSWRTSLTVRM
jgi:hypothetical protein